MRRPGVAATSISETRAMSDLRALDKEARELLALIAENPDGESARRFDALLYQVVFGYLRARSHEIGARVASYAGAKGSAAPALVQEEIAEVAHDATATALRRVREKAARFDPGRGTPTGWACGAAEFAFVEVAKALVRARRSPELSFQDPHDLEALGGYAPSTEEHVISKLGSEQTLEEAVEVLGEREYAAIRLVDTLDYSYAEAAQVIFGDASMTRQVDGLLTRGRSKLAAAWRERRAASAPGAGGKVSGEDAENIGGEDV